MKERIKDIFETCKQEKRAALIVFQSCGFPDLSASEAMIESAIISGADIIELGVPFSDPMADGVVIQKASQIALQKGVCFQDILDMAERIRKNHPKTGLILFSYFNVLLNYGLKKLTAKLADIGIDGILAVDVPYEEKEELDIFCKEQHLHLIPLVSPATPLERAATIVSRASGFIYCVAVCGVTGARSSLPPELKEWVEKLKSITELPLAVGFGVSSGEMAHQISDFADAVVVGSAALKPFFDSVPFEVCLRKSSDLICELRKGVNQKKTV